MNEMPYWSDIIGAFSLVGFAFIGICTTIYFIINLFKSFRKSS